MNGADDTGLSKTSAAEARPFVAALREKIEARRADGQSMAVLLVDCGVIGRIDAIWGYQIGDAVRDRVSALLRTDVLRPDDLVGELGRDDFACVLSTIEDPGVPLLAARKSLRALSAPFWIGEDDVLTDPAIGIAIFPAHGAQAEVLLQRAKSASVMARDLSERVAEHSDGAVNPGAARLLYENRMRTAVAEDAFELLFQPQYDLRLGQVMGAEGLLCWHDRALGLVDTEQAFRAAESAGMVTDLVSSVLNRALRNISEFRYSAGLDLRIGVKLPARALRHPDLVDVVQRALATWSRRPGTLILEIGETSVLGSDAVARATLGRLKELGVKLSIDDAGMALSSLFWLATMPFQEIKIDVSGAPDPAGVAKHERILRSIIELAHHLRLDVVAVGVADDSAAARLKEFGCDCMQADFKSPALAPAEFVERCGVDAD